MSLVYETIRSSRRKTIGLQVKRGKIVVRAPSFLSNTEIDSFVRQKSAWLESKLRIQQSNIAEHSCNFATGSFIWVKGERKKLRVSLAEKVGVRDESARLDVMLSSRFLSTSDQNSAQLRAKVKKHIESWFTQKAEEYLSSRLPELIEQTGLLPNSYKVRKYKARWGSCNNRGELSFNSLLLMVPPWVFDYVIIHELCHLKYPNHSKNFWQLVALYCPYYGEAKQWLKAHQYQLVWQ